LAAVAVWVVTSVVLGLDMQEPHLGEVSGKLPDLGLRPVAITAAGGALLGWAALAVMERFSDRAQTLWTYTAIAVLLLSIAAPLAASEVSDATRAVLVVMHLAVGAVLIPGLARTSTAR
jgi:hypothetical protein